MVSYVCFFWNEISNLRRHLLYVDIKDLTALFGGVGQHLVFASAAVQLVAGLFSARVDTPPGTGVRVWAGTMMGCWQQG